VRIQLARFQMVHFPVYAPSGFESVDRQTFLRTRLNHAICCLGPTARVDEQEGKSNDVNGLKINR